MCDLWQNTLETSVDSGAIPAQVAFALNKLDVPLSGPERAAFQIKLYNSGSFFDPKAIPIQDYAAISNVVSGFGNLIVESHPRLIGDRCLQWKQLISPPLEVAIGLETANSDALDQLNKGFQLRDFQRACETLQSAGIAIRVFLLVNGPFIKPEEQRECLNRSIDVARAAGASVICLIPTRHDSGAMRDLWKSGQFVPTALRQLEVAFDDGLMAGRGRLFADLWDLRSFSQCDQCFDQRRARLEQMNEQQIPIARVLCSHCDGN
jgi:archaeosine synthase beta-subunit